MDANGEKQSLLSGLIDTTPDKVKSDAQRRRRYRRCKSAPLADAVPSEANATVPLKRSGSIFQNLHPSFKKVAIYLVFYLGIGTFCFYFVKNQIKGQKTNGFLDAVYFCIVTMTTVGYGDLVPGSVLTKLLACAFVFSGIALIGLILSKAADYLVEKQEILLVKALGMHQKLGNTQILKAIETNKAKYKCIMVFAFLVMLIMGGTAFLVLVEQFNVIDAFYCVCCTITTLGYGDTSFSTAAGRLFAVFWILTSTICLGQFFLYIAELNTESRQRALVNWVLTRRMTNVDLEAADLDNDGVVSAAEFVLYKLKEMGKISQEDILIVLEEFEDLDFDQSGTLSLSDIVQAQPSE